MVYLKVGQEPTELISLPVFNLPHSYNLACYSLPNIAEAFCKASESILARVPPSSGARVASSPIREVLPVSDTEESSAVPGSPFIIITSLNCPGFPGTVQSRIRLRTASRDGRTLHDCGILATFGFWLRRPSGIDSAIDCRSDYAVETSLNLSGGG